MRGLYTNADAWRAWSANGPPTPARATRRWRRCWRRRRKTGWNNGRSRPRLARDNHMWTTCGAIIVLWSLQRSQFLSNASGSW